MNMTKKMHPFHLVTPSPWPILASFQVFNMVTMGVMIMNNKKLLIFQNFYFNLIILIMISSFWWRDITRESTYENCHTKEVLISLKLGMILFIISEVFFFLSFFWAYFHSSLSPDISIGQKWPCYGIHTFNPMGIPLLNTIILLSSGVSLTSSHHFLMVSNMSKSKIYLIYTIFLGIYFTFLQGVEYQEASFSIADSIYGSTFFMSTGFHGLHVLIGSCFLFTCFYRMTSKHYSSFHHFGFEAAAWYWHFVDVVWLFLYLFIYWFGN
nr:cytochrome c oxidase subunit III [Aptinothrips stylifer]